VTLNVIRLRPDPAAGPEDPRALPELTWRAVDGAEVAGDVSVWLRPDDRCQLFFDVWRNDAFVPLTDAVARDLRRDLYVSLDDGELESLEACAAAGFSEYRRESYYRIPTASALTALTGATMPADLDVLSAANADLDQLRLLDDALRQDVPGTGGWRWTAEGFHAETSGPDFDPATYLVAVARASGAYVGLVRVWMRHGGPRLGLMAMLAPYRRRGATRALLARVFTVLSARGLQSVTCEADDANIASVSLLSRLGARRYGGSVELVRRGPSGR
jgi:ribosomal protein S18 acetylase RimI-like enzyme